MNYIEQKAEEAKAKKRADWEAIKRNDPRLANFILGLKAAFGEVKLKELKFNQREEKQNEPVVKRKKVCVSGL